MPLRLQSDKHYVELRDAVPLLLARQIAANVNASLKKADAVDNLSAL